ncbi:MAG TPA: hypothetical protein VGN17_23565 [Bryobacteraceae bacterium]
MRMPRQLGLLLACMSCAPFAHSQYLVSARAGMVQSTEGAVFLDSKPLRLTPADFPVLNNGQVLRTDNGLAELSLAPGSSSASAAKPPCASSADACKTPKWTFNAAPRSSKS